MKKKMRKLLLCAVLTALLLAVSVVPAFAEDADQTQFQLKDFNPNEIVRVIVSTLVGVLTVAGAVYGGWMLWQGFTGEDPKERRQGVTAILASLLVGGLIIAVVNMIVA